MNKIKFVKGHDNGTECPWWYKVDMRVETEVDEEIKEVVSKYIVVGEPQYFASMEQAEEKFNGTKQKIVNAINDWVESEKKKDSWIGEEDIPIPEL